MTRRRTLLVGTAATLACAAAVALPASAAETGQSLSKTPKATAYASLAPPTSLANASFQVGPAEIVDGPYQYADSFVFGVKVDTNSDGVPDTVRAYSAQNETILYTGSSMADITPVYDGPDHEVVLEGGSSSSDDFDECGAWLQAAFVDPSVAGGQTVRGWYHAEKNCNYPASLARASIAYARSIDGGLSWAKPSHPGNQVIRANPTDFPDPAPNCNPAAEPPDPDCKHTGRGANTVITRGSDYWMYYKDTDSENLHVAKATIGSDGLPGSWKNYTGTAVWTEPGVDGAASTLTYGTGTVPVKGGAASRYTPDGSTVIAELRKGADAGIQLSNSSTDGLTGWVRYAEVLVPVLEQRKWGSSLVTDPQRISCPSIVNGAGAREWGEDFYLFYMYIQPGNTMSQRLLVRRHVTVSTEDTSRPSSLIALASWDTSTRDRWDSASVVSAVYPQAPESIQGYLATVDQDGAMGELSKALHDCENISDGDNYPAQNCLTGDTQRRTTGYIWTSATAQAGTVPLYRCRATSDGDDFVSLDASCEGKGSNKWIAGWVFPD